MSQVIIGGKFHCPLCGKEFKEVRTAKEIFYVCTTCDVSINALDPALGKWDMLPVEECPLCHKPMPTFYRALDGFMVVRCKPCGVVFNIGKEEYMPKEKPAGDNGK
jgi:hypothetical protein